MFLIFSITAFCSPVPTLFHKYFFTFTIWYVFYILLWFKMFVYKFLFLFTFYTLSVSWPFWFWGCFYIHLTLVGKAINYWNFGNVKTHSEFNIHWDAHIYSQTGPLYLFIYIWTHSHSQIHFTSCVWAVCNKEALWCKGMKKSNYSAQGSIPGVIASPLE